MKLIFATNNQHKVDEIQAAIGDRIDIISLKEAGISIEIPEPHATLEENAAEKSFSIYRLTYENCFSEDTGLEVNSLNGAPGVKSARYAGEEKDFKRNIEKLLNELKEKDDRFARFRTVISLIWNGRDLFFEGICKGKIAEKPKGEKGFGYDAVFIPEGADKTFAEMEMEEKNTYSHRKKAADQLVLFLQTQLFKSPIN